MFPTGNLTAGSRTTPPRVVIPFYLYAAGSFLIATMMTCLSSGIFTGHYFHPQLLAITHLMALGWGSMMILGASHQLVPVLTEEKLYSEKLAWTSFILSAIGIPLLVYGFAVFDMHGAGRWGGRFVVLSVLAYLINLGVTITRSKKENVHAVFVFTAVAWLFLTAFFGLVLVYNFNSHLLPRDSQHYLTIHAHAGIAGWFLLLVIGVASRLVPMFLISKYTNPRLLWVIYDLINGALAMYIVIFFLKISPAWNLIPGVALLVAMMLFVRFVFSAWRGRIRRKVDEPMKLSLISVVMTLLPVLLILPLIITMLFYQTESHRYYIAYGFLIFFGWITAIILGMTFKTLPFIVWNKVYHHRASLGKTPNPKDLYSNPMFMTMGIIYLAGFLIFFAGIVLSVEIFLKGGSALLLSSAVLYTWNVVKIISHKVHKV